MALVEWHAPRNSVSAGGWTRLYHEPGTPPRHLTPRPYGSPVIAFLVEKHASRRWLYLRTSRVSPPVYPKGQPPLSPTTERDSPFSLLTARPMSLAPTSSRTGPGSTKLSFHRPGSPGKDGESALMLPARVCSARAGYAQPRIIFTGYNVVWTQFRNRFTSHNRKTKMEKTVRYAEGLRWCEDSGTG